MDSSELTKNKRNRVTANSLSGGGIARPHSNITMNTQVLSSFRLGSRLVSHNKYLVLPFCQPPLCDTDLGSEPEPPAPIAQFNWATRIGNGTGNEGEFTLNATDLDDNIFVVGGFAQSNPDNLKLNDFVSLDSLNIVQMTVGGVLSAPNTGYNIFITKYTPTGQEIWSTKILPDTQSYLESITTDLDGNLYVSFRTRAAKTLTNPRQKIEFYNAGLTTGIPTLYGTMDQPYQPPPTPIPSLWDAEYYGVLVKYDTNGVCQWVTKIQNIDNAPGIYQGIDNLSVSVTKDISPYDIVLSGRFGARTEGATSTYSIVQPYQAYLYEAAQSVAGVIAPTIYGFLSPDLTTTLPPDNAGYGFIAKYDKDGMIKWSTYVELIPSAGTLPPVPGIFIQQNLVRNTTNTNSETYILINMLSTYSPNSGTIINYYNAVSSPPSPLGSQITVTAGAQLDTTALSSTVAFGERKSFIAKYDTNGSIIWSNMFCAKNGIANVEGVDIACDSAGDVYLTGSMTGTIQLFNYDPSSSLPTIDLIANPTELTFTTGNAGLLFRCDSAGTYVWATTISSLSFNGAVALAITLDSNDDICLTGTYYDAITLNSYDTTIVGTPNIINVTSFATLAHDGGGSDIYIIKYDKNGVALWGTSVVSPEPQSNIGYYVSTDTQNNIIVTGLYIGLLEINDYNPPVSGIIDTQLWGKLPPDGPSTSDAFIVKYKPNGKVGL